MTTGDPVGVISCTLVLAYLEGGNPLEVGGPLRIVTLNDSYFTDGHYWSKSVVEIKLIDEVEPWHLELHGVEVWNMTHDIYYSLASCSHHRTEVSHENEVYAGVPLYIIVAAMDGGDDEHYIFNTTLLSTAPELKSPNPPSLEGFLWNLSTNPFLPPSIWG